MSRRCLWNDFLKGKVSHWSKTLKERFLSTLPDLDLDDLQAIVELINLAIEEEQEKIPDCDDCDRCRDREPRHNEGYD